MKVRYISETADDLTKGKKYNVIGGIAKYYMIKDDNGNEVIRFKTRFEIIPSKQLKVGDVLLGKDLQDWCEAGENFYTGNWRALESGDFIGDRTIEAIDIKDGHKAFLVSGTSGAWIRAKGYRKFCKRNENVAKMNSIDNFKPINKKNMNILKVGDKVYEYWLGWLTVEDIENDMCFLYDEMNVEFCVPCRELSFTEYTLTGFSQERPIELPEVGELCLFSDDEVTWKIGAYDQKGSEKYPFHVKDLGSFKYCKRIKFL